MGRLGRWQGDGAAGQAVGHLIQDYLGRSETFIYTQLRFQTEFKPVVFAGLITNLAEFPFEPITQVVPSDASFGRRVTRRTIALTHGYRRTYGYALGRLSRRFRCVLLHAHFGWSGCRALQTARSLQLPLVTTFYGLDITENLGLPYDELFEQGKFFICEGPFMVEHLQAVGCPADKTRLVRIGIDLDRFPYSPKSISTPYVVMHAARFVEKKGVDLAIRAFGLARGELPPAELWLVGDGPLRAELESLVVELGLSDAVKFLGMKSHADFRALTRCVDVMIHPSQTASNGDTEGGAPTVLLEMQAIGVPVVATRHADIPFVVPDPERLVPEKDAEGLAAALVELASVSEGEYRDRARRARRFVEERHDARVVARQIAAVYREALSAPAGG
jgi:colanic acid/amylovoran biosynthesis glycosyltransferase